MSRIDGPHLPPQFRTESHPTKAGAPEVSVNVKLDITFKGGFDQGGLGGLRRDHEHHQHHCCDTLPPPAPDQSHAPAGEGLSTGESPFGPGAVTTAGGYTIVPEGKDQAWDIYAPGQKPGDTPNSHIWGDPHVTEKDGTKWDFTRNSSFRLPDGTNISVSTVAMNGDQAHRLSSTLDITNGADRVQISGVDQNKPVTGKISHDGFQARAELASQDTFTLGGTQDDVKWFKSKDGHNEGEVTGASMVTQADGTAAYEQNVKAGDYVVDPSLQPKPGSAAWGDALRDSLVDTARNLYGSKSTGAELVAMGASIDHTSNTPEGKQLNRILNQLQSMSWLMKFLQQSSSARPFGVSGK
jgi:hypothetical protein